MKTTKLQCNFASNLYYCESNKYSDFTEMLKKKFPAIKDEFNDDGSDFNGETQTISYKDTRYYYIWARKRTNQIIYHEVLHVCLRIAEYIGLPTTANTSEFLTYLQEDLVEQIKKINK